MIYTSYFSNMRHIPSGIIPISIARFNPRWYTGLEYKKLAPPIRMVNWYKGSSYCVESKAAQEIYEFEYTREVLNKLDVVTVVSEIGFVAGFNDKNWCMEKNSIVVLLCYEKSSFCHRHIVAKWLGEYGINIEEYNYLKCI